MQFMQSYKRLDNLCRDMNGIGVTGYLEDMNRESGGAFRVAGWREDYRQLKYYRHIRNQIAHENDATEEALCSEEDTDWIEAFHQRILNQTDPLALYYAAQRDQRSSPSSRKDNSVLQSTKPNPAEYWERVVLLIAMIAVICLALAYRDLL